MKKWLLVIILLAGCQAGGVKEQRIISLMPSNTETLYELGLSSHIVGVSTADDYPEDVKNKKQFDSMNLNKEALLKAKPTLIVAYENQKQQKVLKAMKKYGIKVVYIKEAKQLSDIGASIEQIGKAAGKEQDAVKLAARVDHQIASVKKKYRGKRHNVLMEVSSEPEIYTGGAGTLFNDMIVSLGAKNTFSDIKGWQPVTPEAIVRRNPDTLITTSGMSAAQYKHIVKARGGFNTIDAVKQNRIYAMEADTISRPGPRIAEGLEALAKTIYHD